MSPDDGAGDGSKPAIIVGPVARTYAELNDRTTRLANALRARGVERGDRVAVMLPSGFEFFETGLAVAKAGAVMIPVNWHLKPDEVTWILSDSGATALVADAAFGIDAPPDRAVLWAGANLEDAISDAPSTAPSDPFPTPAFMFYTSGTTGRPKGVLHGAPDPDRLRFVQEMLAQMWGFTAHDVHLLSGPAYHAGPGGYAFTALFLGQTLVVLPIWDARDWLGLVARHRVTTTFMTPAHFIRILEVPPEDRDVFDLSSLRLVLHGAAPCPIDVKERIIEALAPADIYELYGASEGGATRISPAEWRERPGSVGTPWPGVEVRIIDEGGRPVATGADGVIHIAPAGGQGFHYHDDPAKTAAAWHDGAFTVGDIGHVDEEGYLYITDRAVDMVLRDGVNVYPREIEEALHRHPSVVDCAVFGIPDDRHGETLKAVVEVREPVEPADLQAHCRRLLADFKCPETIEFVEMLPRDPNGKVLKRRLRDEATRPASPPR